MEYIRIINGVTEKRSAESIIAIVNGAQIINPTEAQILAAGWQPYERSVVEKTLEDVRNEKIAEIGFYDNSSAVNEFSMGGLPIWLDKATRAGLLLRFEAEAKAGRTSTTLWYNGLPFTLPLTYAQEILIALELYASACYDNTQSHIAEVQKMESKEAVEAYDYTTGYPAKLNF